MSNLNECYKSTMYNPMMNYLPFDKMTRPPACMPDEIESIKEIKYWNDNHTTKLDEITGIPRIYTMPVTTSTQDAIGFANLLYPDTAILRHTGYPTNYLGFAKAVYPNTAICKQNGFTCKSNADNTFSLDRLSYYIDDPYYQKIKTSEMNKWDTPLYDIENDIPLYK